MTEVSVIVPVYNVRPFLPACVASVRGQTMKDLELILVDDGSTDGSGELCDALAKEDARIRVLHTENGGQGRARNLGLDVAQGEYISFVDADDVATPEMLAAALAQARQENADMVVFGIKERYVDSQGQVVQERGELRQFRSGGRNMLEEIIRCPDMAVGDLCARQFNIRGEFIDCGFNQRLIGIDEEGLRGTKHVLALAVGGDKVLPIIGALRIGVIHYFCTDENTARQLLALLETSDLPT